MRLGFPVRVVGLPTLRSHLQRHTPPPHLSIHLTYLRDILAYLQRVGVRFYRIAPAFLPFPASTASIGDTLAGCHDQIALLSQHIAEQDVRLTVHLNHGVALGSGRADATTIASMLAQIEHYAAFFDHLTGHPDSVIVVHVGGKDTHAATRFVSRYNMLSPQARARLVVEHDGAGASLGTVLWLHQQCSIPVVFDYLHWQLHNPEHFPLDIALGLSLATWPVEGRPKVHLSTARSEAHLIPARHKQSARVIPPRPGQHADFVAVGDAIALLRAARGLPAFDVMIEAKAGDVALMRLREEVPRHAPDLTPLIADGRKQLPSETIV